MFYHIFYPLRDIWFGFNVFKYITFRAAFAAISAFLLCITVGPFIIRLLKRQNICENTSRPFAPLLDKYHGLKSGTPTMGGILIVGSILASTLLWARLDNSFIWLVVMGTLCLAIVGFIDDYIKLYNRKKEGLRAMTKFAGQLMIGLGLALFLYTTQATTTRLYFPFFKKLVLEMGIFFIPFVVIVVVGSSNAVNLTDGLDGLAVGSVAFIAAAFAAICYVAGHLKISNYLAIPFVPQASELTVFCSAILGSALGFLWFNSHPATVFMGDTGSLSLGGAIGMVSVLTKKEMLLFFVGGVFVIEALSVIVQVIAFKLTGKKLFLMAPIHHHYQLRGYDESKITVRFWIICAILAVFSLVTLKLR